MFCSNLKHCFCCIQISQGLIFWSLFDLLAQLLSSFILFQWMNVSDYRQSLPLMAIFICNVLINLFLMVAIVQGAKGKLLVWQYTMVLNFLAIFGYMLYLHLKVYPGMDVVLMGIVLPILFCYYGYWWLLVNSHRRQISSATVSPFKEQEVKIRQDDIYHIEERESQVESYNNQGIENPYRVPSHRFKNLPLRLHTPLSTPSHLHSPLSYPLTPLPTYTSGYVSTLQEQELILRRDDKNESPRDSCNTIVVELNS